MKCKECGSTKIKENKHNELICHGCGDCLSYDPRADFGQATSARFRLARLGEHNIFTNSPREDVLGYYETIEEAVEVAERGARSYVVRDTSTGLIVYHKKAVK